MLGTALIFNLISLFFNLTAFFQPSKSFFSTLRALVFFPPHFTLFSTSFESSVQPCQSFFEPHMSFFPPHLACFQPHMSFFRPRFVTDRGGSVRGNNWVCWSWNPRIQDLFCLAASVRFQSLVYCLRPLCPCKVGVLLLLSHFWPSLVLPKLKEELCQLFLWPNFLRWFCVLYFFNFFNHRGVDFRPQDIRRTSPSFSLRHFNRALAPDFFEATLAFNNPSKNLRENLPSTCPARSLVLMFAQTFPWFFLSQLCFFLCPFQKFRENFPSILLEPSVAWIAFPKFWRRIISGLSWSFCGFDFRSHTPIRITSRCFSSATPGLDDLMSLALIFSLSWWRFTKWISILCCISRDFGVQKNAICDLSKSQSRTFLKTLAEELFSPIYRECTPVKVHLYCFALFWVLCLGPGFFSSSWVFFSTWGVRGPLFIVTSFFKNLWTQETKRYINRRVYFFMTGGHNLYEPKTAKKYPKFEEPRGQNLVWS